MTYQGSSGRSRVRLDSFALHDRLDRLGLRTAVVPCPEGVDERMVGRDIPSATEASTLKASTIESLGAGLSPREPISPFPGDDAWISEQNAIYIDQLKQIFSFLRHQGHPKRPFGVFSVTDYT